MATGVKQASQDIKNTVRASVAQGAREGFQDANTTQPT
jgi:hypothetical protein